MSKIHYQYNRVGLAPDALVFEGKKKQEHTSISFADYDKEHIDFKNSVTLKECLTLKNASSSTWVNVNGLHDLELLEEITNQYGIDRTFLAEVTNTYGRPKALEFEDSIFFSMKMISVDAASSIIEHEHLSFILLKNNLLSFQEVEGDLFSPIRERLKNPSKRIRQLGVDYLAFALMDVVIDNYLHVILNMGEKIEEIEENLIDSSEVALKKINHYKKELNLFRKSIIPVKEILNSMIKMENDFLSKKSLVHFKDLQSNLAQAIETADSYREILTDQLSMHHTNAAASLNDTMKFLTVFSVIFIPLTFIAGIYGTNFTNMPEKDWEYGYAGMWGLMIIVAIIMLLIFKKKKWL